MPPSTDLPLTTPSAALAADPVASVACAHCGLPVPKGLLEPDAPRQFCCHGCRGVYEMLHQCGLEEYYRLREREAAGEAQPARSSHRGYGEFDDPAFQKLYVKPIPGGLLTVELYLEGVHCSACVWLLEKLPGLLPGVSEARLNLSRSLLRVVWLPTAVNLSAIASTLARLGYPPHPARGVKARDTRRLEERRYLIRLGIAGALAGNCMLLALALYAGLFSKMEQHYHELFRWLSMGLDGLSLLWPGKTFFVGAWAAMRTRTAHLDLPIALGLAAGGVAGVINTWRGAGEIYFDSLAVLVFFLLVGRYLHYRQQRRADDAVELLFSLTPTHAQRLNDTDEPEEVAIESLVVGDRVLVRAGDSVPADGTVLSGQSRLDQALLTGEPEPVAVGPGATVAAGAVNIQAALVLRVAATGEDTRVARLLRLVEECSRQKAPMVLLADRLAGWFVLLMLSLASLTLLIWWPRDPAAAIEHAVALLIVACPCAIGLATPLALAVAIGRAAKRGLLIKGGDTLERLARPGRMFLDKTGTLTQGRVSLLAWHGDLTVQPLVAALEAQSSHPAARALVAGLASATPPEQPATGVHQWPAGGITGTVAGQELAVGSLSFITGRGASMSPALADTVDQILGAGQTPVLVASGQAVLAVAALGDAIRPEAAGLLARLRQLGWQVGILSGDHPAVAQRVGRQLGLAAADISGGLTPEDKLERVRLAQRAGRVVMVGDGVNDAAALAAADVGIAVHGGAEASLAAAAVYLSQPGIGVILELVEHARHTVRVIRRNLAISLGYNLLAMTLAMTGLLNPLVAAILMPISSLTVLTLSLGNRNFRPKS